MARAIIDEVVKAEIQRRNVNFDNLDFQAYAGKVEVAPIKIAMYDGSYKTNNLISEVKTVFNSWQIERSDGYWIEFNNSKYFMPQPLLRLFKTLVYCQMHTNQRISSAVAIVFMQLFQGYVMQGKVIIPDFDTMQTFTTKTQEIFTKELFEWIAGICEGNGIPVERPITVTAKEKIVKKSSPALEQKSVESEPKRKRSKGSAASALSGK